MTNRLPVVGKKYFSDYAPFIGGFQTCKVIGFWKDKVVFAFDSEESILDDSILYEKEPIRTIAQEDFFKYFQEMKEEPVNPLQIIMDYMQEEIKLRQKTYAMLKEKYPELLKNYNLK